MADMKKVWTLLLTIGLSYLGLCLCVYLAQARLVYFPTVGSATDPSAHGIAFRDLTLETGPETTVHAWLLEAREPRGLLLFAHGNAGNIDHRIELARPFLDMGLSVLLFDYRGYGTSRGTPSEAGLYADALAAFDRLVAENGRQPAPILGYGESLGAAILVELARHRPLAALILESPFTSLPDVGAQHYPWLPVRWLARDRYDNRAKVGKLATPLLVIHSRSDEIVPFAHGQALHDEARGPKELLVTSGGHNDGGFRLRPEWIGAVGAFVDRALEEDSR
jgi:fermentation-respiration switch protein FrsA (DUF1100 family)